MMNNYNNIKKNENITNSLKYVNVYKTVRKIYMYIYVSTSWKLNNYE